MNKENKEQKSRVLSLAVPVFSLIVLIIAILMLLHGCSDAETDADGKPGGIEYDESATVGGWTSGDTEKITEELNEKVKEGMINISMNTSPYADKESGIANLMIVNETINRYPQSVTLILDETGEEIYRSGAIPVGSKIESAKLSIIPTVGKHSCTAMFTSLDPVSGEPIGSAGAVISLTVE